MKPVYQQLAQSFDAYLRCQEGQSLNPDAGGNHREVIERICKLYLPHGSWFDCGTTIDLDGSSPECLVLCTNFHHMDEHGGYDGWTDHAIKVKPSLAFGFDLEIEGEDRDGIHDYIADVFRHALSEFVDFGPLIRDVWGR
jgi:hypothetical protein